MNNPSVNIWKKHYETMANGQGKNKQKQSNTRRGLTKTYRVKGLQTGSGNKKPSIEVVSPAEAVVNQAKMQIQHMYSKDNEAKYFTGQKPQVKKPKKRKYSSTF